MSITDDFQKELDAWRKSFNEAFVKGGEFLSAGEEWEKTKDDRTLQKARQLQGPAIKAIDVAQTKLAAFKKAFAKFQKENAKRIKKNKLQGFVGRLAAIERQHEGDLKILESWTKNFPFPKK